MKKQWKKPVVTVLVRTRPEESLMSTCKSSGGTGAVLTNCVETDLVTNCIDIALS